MTERRSIKTGEDEAMNKNERVYLERATLPHLMHLGLLRPRRLFEALELEGVTVAVVATSVAPLLLFAGDEAAIQSVMDPLSGAFLRLRIPT